MAFPGNPMLGYWRGLYPGTPAERALEPHIAALSYPYRTQFPWFIWGLKYFPDYMLPTVGVIVEVDDDSHLDPEKQKADQLRSAAFAKMGYRVIRCTNNEALHTPQVVIRRITDLLAKEGPRDLGLPPAPVYTKRPKRRVPRGAKKRAQPSSPLSPAPIAAPKKRKKSCSNSSPSS